MPWGAELPGVALRAEHGQQILEGITQAFGVVVGKLVNHLEKAAQGLGVAVGQIGVLENITEQRRDTGVLRHSGNGLGVKIENLVSAQAGVHQFGPAVTGEVIGEKAARAAELFALGVNVIHELVDERNGNLFDLTLGVRHLADEEVAGGVNTAFGGGLWDFWDLTFRGFRGLGIALIFLVELLVGDSFEFKASGAKIDEQPDFQIVRLQVVDLCQMNVFQLDNSLQLYTDNIAHQKIHPSRPDVLAFE